MKRALFSLLLPLLFSNFLSAAEDPYLREPVRQGIDAIYDLDYAGAQKIFDRLKSEHPENPVGYGMTAVTAWHELLFSGRNLAIYKHGIPTPFDSATPIRTGSPTPVEKRFVEANKTLQDVCEKLLKTNPRNALALYFKGVSYENLSTRDITLDRRYSLSVRHAKAAGKLHQEALKLDPVLIDSKTSTAVPEYVVGNLHWSLRWISMLIGMKGDKKGAVDKLQEVAEKGIYRSSDAKVVMALLEAWKGDPKHAVSLFSSLRTGHPRNFMYDVSLAVAYEEAGNDPRSAIRIYEELLGSIPSKAAGVQPGEIHLRIAKSYLKLHDERSALEHFRKAVQAGQADAETKPLAYYSMGIVYEKRKETETARECYRKAVQSAGATALIEKEIAYARKKLR